MKSIGFIAAILSGVAMFTGAAGAQDSGRIEYINACAACHGMDGTGGGPLVELLTVPVPGLTTLSAQNEGKFPMLEVIHTIDGRQSAPAHGGTMPIWGRHFEIQAELDDVGPYGGEAVVRGRILSIAYYLESIQE